MPGSRPDAALAAGSPRLASPGDARVRPARKNHLAILIATFDIQADGTFLVIDLRYGNRSRDGVAHEHRTKEPILLAGEDRARSRADRAEHCSDQARVKRTMNDALAEQRRRGKSLVEMNRIVIANQLGERGDLLFPEPAGQLPGVSEADVLEGSRGRNRARKPSAK